jgi:hypothetical protein
MSLRTQFLLLVALVSVPFLIVTDAARPQDKRDPVNAAKQPQQPKLLAADEITFPADWNKPSPPCANRQLVNQARKLLKALNTPMTIDVQDSTLEDVLTYLQDKAGITIVLPQAILDEWKISSKTPVCINLKSVTLRTILKKVLGDLDLTYIINKEVIEVRTEERAKKAMTTRAYPIRDLALLVNPRLKQTKDETKWRESADDIIKAIVDSIDPKSWSANGGPGKITFDLRTKSLVVTQSTEIHYRLAANIGAPSDSSPSKNKATDSGTKVEKIPSTQQLLDALKMPLTVDWEDTTFEPFLKYLSEKAGVRIVIAQVLRDKKVVNLTAPVSIHLKGVSLSTVLKKALSQVTDEELDFAFREGALVITRPRLATHPVDYEIRDLIEQMPLLFPILKKENEPLYEDLRQTDGPGVLVRYLANEVELKSWETIEVRNKSRLLIHASPLRHEEIAGVLSDLRRMLDVAVVMNARLYEIDRAFYTKHIAPLFAKDKDSEDRAPVRRIDAPLLMAISKEKVLLESEKITIRPSVETTFLAQQSLYLYAAGLGSKKEGGMHIGTGLAGVSFDVRPLVSLDRRYLRLRISQRVVQLTGMDKTKRRDASTGKEFEVEVPTLRKATVTGTVQIPDTAPILMLVDYRPPGKVGEDKVWLLVARPFIWIKEEEEERRQGKENVPFQSHIWDLDVPEDEKPAPVTPLPSDDQTMAILRSVVKDALTNPDLEYLRESFGTPKDKTFTLIDGDKLGWPKKFHPDRPGFKLVEVKLDPFVDQNRVLGIRLDRFDLKQKDGPHVDEPIMVCLFNAGGHANGHGADNGGFVYYKPKRVGHHWTVQFCGAEAQ